jgi:hypothetical protein
MENIILRGEWCVWCGVVFLVCDVIDIELGAEKCNE